MSEPSFRDPGAPSVVHQTMQLSAAELLQSVPEALLCVDRDGRIAFANVQAEQLFGYQHTEMLGRAVESLLPDGLERAARRKNGSEFPVEISSSSLEPVSGLQLVTTIRDLTTRREIESNWQQSLDAAEQARSAAQAALEIRAEAERLKDNLINMVVHDLKNPLTGIAMMVQLVLRKGPLSDVQQRLLLQVDRTCRELQRLTGNILEIAKLDAGEMPVTIEPVVLRPLADEVEAEYGPVAADMGRRLSVTVGSDLSAVAADQALLKRVLVNLVANALRHSGSVEVRIEADLDATGTAMTIRVVDAGRGIPDDEQGRIFEKFQTVRGDSTADYGLGLPFCKLAVERMGGQIVLRSALGVGTEFAVTLPAASAT